ncbi:hypothetical protein HD554DRAFT_281128 [Boletus coccyginus]|nr:hypothetical protein HD554DRAFT_281128 [Boletus coccyginus]
MLAIRRRRPEEINDSPQKRQPVSLVYVDQTTFRFIRFPSSPSSRLRCAGAAQTAFLDHQLVVSQNATLRLTGPSHFVSSVALTSRSLETMPVVLIIQMERKKYLASNLTRHTNESTCGEWSRMDSFSLLKWCMALPRLGEQFVTKVHPAWTPCKMGAWPSLFHAPGLEDPNSPEGAPLPESIGSRELVFYDRYNHAGELDRVIVDKST